jgi:hypothetical protein
VQVWATLTLLTFFQNVRKQTSQSQSQRQLHRVQVQVQVQLWAGDFHDQSQRQRQRQWGRERGSELMCEGNLTLLDLQL